jgi:hypothetical protein
MVKEILISYLMVGHMHKKVDRDLFATVGNLKKIKNCPIPEKFPSFVGKSFTKCPQKPVFHLDPLFWLGHVCPYLFPLYVLSLIPQQKTRLFYTRQILHLG